MLQGFKDQTTHFALEMTSIRNEIAQLENRMVIKTGAMITAAMVFAATMKFF
jgi:hypothetical protein